VILTPAMASCSRFPDLRVARKSVFSVRIRISGPTASCSNARISWRPDSSTLGMRHPAAGIRYRFQLLPPWSPPSRLVRAGRPGRAQTIRHELHDLEEAFALTVARHSSDPSGRFSRGKGLLHDARLSLVENLPAAEEPTLHFLLATSMRAGPWRAGKESFAETRFLMNGAAKTQ